VYDFPGNVSMMFPRSGGEGGGVVVRAFDLGSNGAGFDRRVVPKSERMFVNIYHY